MYIILSGNICTGKTTLAKKMHELSGYRVYSIDDYRIKHNRNSTAEGEFNAWLKLRTDIETDGNECGIFESSGTSMWHQDVLSKMKGEKIHIRMIAPVNVILDRYLKRKTKIPMPYDISDVKKSINIIKNKLDKKHFDFTFDSSKMTVEEMINEINKQ